MVLIIIQFPACQMSRISPRISNRGKRPLAATTQPIGFFEEMLPGNNLQEAQLAREEAKILRRREENEIRRQRYLQAKVRLIGVDVQALNDQVAEKQRMKQHERDTDKFERLQAIEIERMLAQVSY